MRERDSGGGGGGARARARRPASFPYANEPEASRGRYPFSDRAILIRRRRSVPAMTRFHPPRTALARAAERILFSLIMLGSIQIVRHSSPLPRTVDKFRTRQFEVTHLVPVISSRASSVSPVCNDFFFFFFYVIKYKKRNYYHRSRNVRSRFFVRVRTLTATHRYHRAISEPVESISLRPFRSRSDV